MEDNPDDPLVRALPPASDYLTYLTIIEYNLTKERLPLFRDILEDTTLTTNIGWDLVHLLLPLLPESESCLETVAKLGNPREVILKVTEMIEDLARDDRDEQHDGRGDVSHGDRHDSGEATVDGSVPNGEISRPKPALSKGSGRGLALIQLLKMLEVLHPRIKTKYPSRFLSTSLDAIESVYASMATEINITVKIIQFVRSILATTKPPLPPRDNTSFQQAAQSTIPAPDPEDEHETLDMEELRKQKGLLQIFIIQVIESFGLYSQAPHEDAWSAWSTRFQEAMHPEKTLPDKLTYNQRCGQDEKLFERQRLWLSLYDTAFELGLKREDLREAILAAALRDPQASTEEVQSSTPLVEISLPPTGSLILLCCSLAVWQFHALKPPHTNISLFPDYATLVTYFIGRGSLSYIGTEAPLIVDGVIFLGFTIFASNRTAATSVDQPEVHEGESVTESQDYPPAPVLEYPPNYETYHALLQRLSLLSAQCPFPSLRYNAHLLTSQILHAHPDDAARFRFITDTLTHCPYENLKASAIGWLKTEVLLADRQPGIKESVAGKGIFLQKGLLKGTAASSALLPSLPSDRDNREGQQSLSQRCQVILPLSSLLLASLNFWILLLASPILCERYDILDIAEETGFQERYLLPLTRLMTMDQQQVVGQDRKDEDHDEKESVDELANIKLLGTVAEMVMDKLEDARRIV